MHSYFTHIDKYTIQILFIETNVIKIVLLATFILLKIKSTIPVLLESLIFKPAFIVPTLYYCSRTNTLLYSLSFSIIHM